MNQTKTRIPGTPIIQANKYFMIPCFSRVDEEQFCFHGGRNRESTVS